MHLKILKKAQYISSVTSLYGVTLFLLFQSVLPLLPVSTATAQVQNSVAITSPALPYTKEVVVLSGKPVKLTIPSLFINKEVLQGVYDSTNNTWVVSDAGVHYAGPSAPPNDQSGSTLIYGHNNKFTFGPLQYLEPGDLAQVITENNLVFTYVYAVRNDFSPSDTSIFDYKGAPTLSLQTCTGWLNQIRSLYTFNLQKVDKL